MFFNMLRFGPSDVSCELASFGSFFWPCWKAARDFARSCAVRDFARSCFGASILDRGLCWYRVSFLSRGRCWALLCWRCLCGCWKCWRRIVIEILLCLWVMVTVVVNCYGSCGSRVWPVVLECWWSHHQSLMQGIDAKHAFGLAWKPHTNTKHARHSCIHTRLLLVFYFLES